MSTPSDPVVCDNKTLFISVVTRPDSFERRSSIRRSWASELPDNVILRFFVGQSDNTTYLKLEEEQRRFGDIVLCYLPDEYSKLYLKVHAVMQWQQTFCKQASFWLKTDDDTTVHVPRLLHHIEKRFRPAMSGTSAQFGYLLTMVVDRNERSKWYVPRELFADNVYPPYCLGASYLVSNDAVAAILRGTHFVKAFTPEDALYTGVIAGKMGVQKSSQADVFSYAHTLQKVTKCDEAGVPLSSAVFILDGNPEQRQADTLSFMKNQTCA
ncbi:Glycosyl transferase [Aphelenchoides avenae]|nr:Glycosyl transferase [Aphelenchus avenae]